MNSRDIWLARVAYRAGTEFASTADRPARMFEEWLAANKIDLEFLPSDKEEPDGDNDRLA